jgi:hypothetical protein
MAVEIPTGVLKTVEAAKRFAFGLALLAAFMLFLPDGFYQSAQLTSYRESYKGVWWIVLVLCGGFSVEEYARLFVGRYIAERDRKRQRREAQEDRDRVMREAEEAHQRQQQEEEEARRVRMETVKTRCSSLSAGEREIIAYCLLENRQSITIPISNPAIGQLVHKELISHGGGRPTGAIFRFPDDAWECLKSQSDEFLPPDRTSEWVERLRRSISAQRDWMST